MVHNTSIHDRDHNSHRRRNGIAKSGNCYTSSGPSYSRLRRVYHQRPCPPTPMPPTPVPPTTTLTPAAANFVNSPILDFTLENLSVAVGTTIIWENQDAAPHTTTSDVPADKTDI